MTPPPLDFTARVRHAQPDALRAESVRTVMVNVGRRCNLACLHCHQSSSPDCDETMSLQTARQALELTRMLCAEPLDITGGSPELWPHIREFVTEAQALNVPVRVRTNLVALGEDVAPGLSAFLAENRVSLLGSLPGTTASAVSAQRGDVYERCLSVLTHLTSLGYGTPGGPKLELAYNPPLGTLTEDECELESRFARALEPLGVHVGRVRAITNVPVGRFRERLSSAGELTAYTHRLADAFNPESLSALSCRQGIEVAWDGRLYDCDFNLGARLATVDGPLTVEEALGAPASLAGRHIAFGSHCFACTAGAGSG